MELVFMGSSKPITPLLSWVERRHWDMSHKGSNHHQQSFQCPRNQRTRKEPQTNTLPSSVSAAV